MPELKYVISGDEKGINESFKNVQAQSAKTAAQVTKDFEKARQASAKASAGIMSDQKKLQQRGVKLEILQPDPMTSNIGTAVNAENIKRNAAANEANARSVGKVVIAKTEEAVATKAVTAAQQAQMKSILQLQTRMEFYQAAAAKATNPLILADYNKKIQSTQLEITRLSNIGKTGFDNMGNSIAKNTGGLTKMWTGLRTVAQLIPGIGLAGLIAFAVEPIMKYIASLDIFGDKVNQIAKNLEAYNEVNRNANKEAGEQVSTLKILYNAATDVTIATSQRTKVAKELQRVFPEAFKNSKTQAILNGDEKRSYDELTQSILASAKAKAAKEKLDQIEAKRLDISFQKEKIRNANINEKRRGADEIRRGIETVNANYTDKQAKFRTSDEAMNRLIENNVFKPSDQRAAEALRLQDLQDKILENQSNFLVKYVGAEDLAKAVIDTPKENGSPKTDPALAAQKALQDKLDDLHDQANKKQMTDDEQELETVRLKYQNMRKEVEDYYKQHKKYKVDASNLDKDEQAEINTILKKRREDEGAAEAEKFQELIARFQTYAKQREQIILDANIAADKLFKEGFDEQARLAIEMGKEQVTAIDEANIETWDSYKALFENLENLTKEQTLLKANELEKQLQAELVAGKKTQEAVEEVQKKIYKVKSSLNRGDGRELDQVLHSLREISTEFNNIDGSIGSITASLINSARAYLEIKEGMKVIKDDKASDTAKIGAGIGIAGAAMAVANSIAGWFKGLKKAKEEARKAMAEFHSQAIEGERDYQALLRKREQDTAVRGKNSYRAIVAQLELLKSQAPEIQAAFDKVYASLQGQSMVAGVGYKHGTWLRKAKTWDIMASLAGSDYERLEELYTQGKLKDQAKSDFESLKSLREELEAAGLAVEDLQKQMNEMLTGTSASGLASSLSDLFENGKFAAQDFATSFEDIMATAIKNSFRLKVMEDAMQPFYDEFASLFVSGTPTEEQINALKSKYEALGLQLGEQFRNLENITGQSLAKPSNAGVSNSLQGVYSTASQESISLLASQTGGLRAAAVDILSQVKVQTSLNQQCVNMAMQNIAIANKIEMNTRITSEVIRSVDTSLKSIDYKIGTNASAAKAAGF